MSKYQKINFVVEQFPGCCGIGIACYFEEASEYDYQWYWQAGISKKVQNPTFKTEQEQAEDCYKRILNQVFEEEKYTTCMIALVSKYEGGKRGDEKWATNKDGSIERQFGALQDLLVENGWEITHQFINPNHGNENTVFTIHFPPLVEEYNKAFNDEDNGIYEDEEEVDDAY